MRKKVPVECSACGEKWEKRKDGLNKWSGKCRRCVMKKIKEETFVQRTCSILGCREIYNSNGYCSLHYQRWIRHGNPHQTSVKMLSFNRPGELTEHLLQNRKITENGCWEWGRHHSNSGYGRQVIDGKDFSVHRLIAHLYLQFDLQSEKIICHACDNTLCFNPSHLFIGTYKDNTEDMFKKNRANKARGERSGRALLTERQVLEIHKMLDDGIVQDRIAEQFSISQSAVSLIKRKKNWAHVV